MDDDLIGLRELAELLERAPVTIRQWVRKRALPRELRPKKMGGRKQLVWHRDQVEALQEFAREREKNKGWQHTR